MARLKQKRKVAGVRRVRVTWCYSHTNGLPELMSYARLKSVVRQMVRDGVLPAFALSALPEEPPARGRAETVYLFPEQRRRLRPCVFVEAY